MNSKNYSRAVKAFEEAYEKDRGNKVIKQNLITAYNALANSCADKNSWEKAVRYAKKAYDLDRSNNVLSENLSVFYTNYAYVKMKSSSYSSAKLNLKKALNYNKNNWAAYVALGRIAYDEGDIAKTVKYWEKAVSLNPELSQIQQQLVSLKKEQEFGDDFKDKRYGYFEVKYEGYKKEKVARKVINFLDKAYDEVGSDFRYYPRQTIPVIIYTKDQFKDMTGSPDWIGGSFDGIIRVNAFEGASLKRILYHEYTHALLYRKTGNNLPVWFNEGLAQYEEPGGDKIQKNDIDYIKQCAKDGNLIPLSELDQAFFDRLNRERLHLAYVEAKLLVNYMDQRYYFHRIRFILEELSKGKTMDEALEKVLHIDSKELEKRWLRWLSDKYKVKIQPI